MKVRTDFVTNSSSSSFILAKKGELNDRQKEALLSYIECAFLGEEVLTPESTEEEKERFCDEEGEYYEDEIKKSLKEGKSIYQGYVCYEDADNYYAKIFENIWNILEKYGDGNFETINDDLSY